MKRLIIISIAILTILSCCKKDDLQPEEYKFYCKVDGVEWKRTTEGNFCTGCSSLKSDYYARRFSWDPKGSFEIRANRTIDSLGIRKTIILYVGSELKEGENNLSIRDILIDDDGLCGDWDAYSLDSSYSNQFVVNELDMTGKRITGTFDLRVVRYNCTPPDTILISDGHFNLRPTWHE